MNYNIDDIRKEARHLTPIRLTSKRKPYNDLAHPIFKDGEIIYDANFPSFLKKGEAIVYCVSIENPNSPTGWSHAIGECKQEDPRARIRFYKNVGETQEYDNARTISQIQDIILETSSNKFTLYVSCLEITTEDNRRIAEDEHIKKYRSLGLHVLNMTGFSD